MRHGWFLGLSGQSLLPVMFFIIMQVPFQVSIGRSLYGWGSFNKKKFKQQFKTFLSQILQFWIIIFLTTEFPRFTYSYCYHASYNTSVNSNKSHKHKTFIFQCLSHFHQNTMGHVYWISYANQIQGHFTHDFTIIFSVLHNHNFHWDAQIRS